MNRKDFELLARALKASKPPTCYAMEAGWYSAVVAIADILNGAVAGFDRAKFLKLCGVVS